MSLFIFRSLSRYCEFNRGCEKGVVRFRSGKASHRGKSVVCDFEISGHTRDPIRGPGVSLVHSSTTAVASATFHGARNGQKRNQCPEPAARSTDSLVRVEKTGASTERLFSKSQITQATSG